MIRDNINIGTCKILWTPSAGTEVDMGFTREGVSLEVNQTNAMLEVEELAAPFDAVIDKLEITAEIELVDARLDNIAIGLGALKTTVTTTSSVDLNPLRGAYLSFGKLVFHPRALASSDKTRDVTIWKAMVQGGASRIFKATEYGTVKFSIMGASYYDTVTSKWKLYTVGDTTTAVGFTL